MPYDEQTKKDMELYPLIEPVINYFSNKALNIGHGTKKVASDLITFRHRYLEEKKKDDKKDNKKGGKGAKAESKSDNNPIKLKLAADRVICYKDSKNKEC